MTFWICASVAACSITMTMESSLLLRRGAFLVHRHSLQPAALVDDPLEDTPDRGRIQGAGVLAHHTLQDPRLALGRVHREPQRALDLADLHRACGAAVQQAHELLVDCIYAATPSVDVGQVAGRGRALAPSVGRFSFVLPRGE